MWSRKASSGTGASGSVPMATVVSEPAAAASAQLDKRYRVKFDFKAESAVELSVKQNDFVSSNSTPSDGWLKVRTSRRGRDGANETVEGLVPFDYLDDITPAPKLTASSSQRAPPPPPSAAALPKTVAEEHGECPICYYDWTTKPACVLLRADGKRSCRHFLHKECVERMAVELRSKTCALCREPYHALKQVPDHQADSRGWFSCVDYDQNGRLSKQEVLDILGVLLPVDSKAVEKGMATLWSNWDTDNNGEIDYQEFCGRGGLLEYVQAHFAKAQGKPPPPLSLTSREAFFTYWDEDGNGTLSCEEIVRATIKTLRLDVARINLVRDYLKNIWPIIDPDNSGEVDMREFIQRDGLAEILIAYAEGLTA